MTLAARPLDPIGAELSGLDIGDLKERLRVPHTEVAALDVRLDAATEIEEADVVRD